jgi:replicative DNA helicase
MSIDLTQGLPANHDVELQLLARLVFTPQVINDVMPLIRVPDFFYYESNASIWKAIQDLWSANQQVNLTTVQSWLENHGILGSKVDRSTIRDLMQDALIPTDPLSMVAQLDDLFQRRRLSWAGTAIVTLSSRLSVPLDEVRSEAESVAFEATRTEKLSELVSLDDLLIESWEQYEERMSGGIPQQIPTGLQDLDEMLGGGIRLGTLTVIQGRPAAGKTAALMTMARKMGQQNSVAIFSLEMSRAQLVERILVASGVNGKKWQRGIPFNDRESAKASNAISQNGGLSIWIDEKNPTTVAEIGSKIRRHQARVEAKGAPPLRCVFIDYLQLLCPGSGRGILVDELSRTTKGLVAIAKELNIAIVLLSQISRANEKMGDKRPTLSDSRGGGCTEEDAAVVIGLYREAYYNPQAGPEAEFIVLKNRFGSTGTVKTIFDGPQMQFLDITSGNVESA